MKFGAIFKPAFLAGAALSLGGCMYGGLGVGISDGNYGDGYVNGGYSSRYAGSYGCNPYDPFDNYYACDYGYGFTNIGFGGGWYDSFYYPGYGHYLFDRRGYRHAMKHHHRRHWARKRAHYDANHGHDGHQLTPEQRAEKRQRRMARRDHRDHDSADGMQHQRRKGQQGETVRGGRRGNGGNAMTGNNGRRGGAVRNPGRPTMAAQQRQSRPAQSRPTRPAPQQAATSRRAPTPAQVKPSRPRSSPRSSPRSTRSDRQNTNID